ncbi:MAG: AraC family transcriptional regulator [Proteobacteria bacterium]|nr:AraC family transcriptional regulator [Pseudomonadota bacterium]MBU1596437.1 AraC family transcriptional regulator [Pseudomonadota bacterium]
MKTDTHRLYAERILLVLRHVQRHLDEPLDLAGLAAQACFSVSHFHRVFKGMLGETIMDHVRRIRLERACVQLITGSANVTDIALDAGYDSLEAFSRSFRKTFGLSPSACRKQGDRPRFPAAPSGVHYASGELVEIILSDTGEAFMNVRIETLPERRLAMVRAQGPYMESAPKAWGALCAYAQRKNLFGPQTLLIGISHDDPSVTAPGDIRYDAAIPVESHVLVEPPVSIGTLPGGEYAVISHQGPHEGLEEAYGAIMGRWLPQSGREMRDSPSFEIYRNTLSSTPPEQLLTDIHIPLK